ncbi:MAG: hypothetical protein JO257_10005 [Deltaproteobacteria bacterium]|nr:hypothetical protein [Deltaproteobacteria bacterium]
MTASRAVLIGHLRVTLPVVVLCVAGIVVGRLCGATRLGGLGGIAVGWLAWSFLVPRWRDWVEDQGLAPDDVYPLALRSYLVWPRGSFIERTEFRRRDGRRGW